MSHMARVVLFLIGVLLGIMLAVVAASAADTMLACPQANGTMLYTNKDVKDCKIVVGPELSIVPSYDKETAKDRTLEHNAVEIPARPILHMQHAPVESEVVAKTCAMYREWILINERTKGGFEYNDVEDTKKRLYLTKIFGSGFSPTMCKEQ